jgi:hypothetical protein
MAFECFTSGHLSRVAICICFKCDCVFNLSCSLLMIIARAMRVEIQVMQEPVYRLTQHGVDLGWKPPFGHGQRRAAADPLRTVIC